MDYEVFRSWSCRLIFILFSTILLFHFQMLNSYCVMKMFTRISRFGEAFGGSGVLMIRIF